MLVGIAVDTRPSFVDSSPAGELVFSPNPTILTDLQALLNYTFATIRGSI
jgi:hypothetical protein